MVDRVYFPNPVQPGASRTPRPEPSGKTGGSSPFAGVLDNAVSGELKFSQHAEARLKSRGIALGTAEMEKLKGAVDTLASKGGKESLVMVGDAALVVSVKNRTVITAMDKSQLQGNVFTNIDSAMVL